MHLPWAHRTRLQQLLLLVLTNNVSNKSGNLLFAQSYPSSMKALDSCTVGAQSHPHLLRDTIVVHGLSGAVSRFKKSIEMLRFWKRYRWISPIERRNGLIVKPCTNTEKATTAKLMVMISSRCATSRGNPRARASANAPRTPPQNKTC